MILLTWVKPCVYIGTKRKFQFFAEINKIKIFSLPGKKTGPAARRLSGKWEDGPLNLADGQRIFGTGGQTGRKGSLDGRVFL